MRSNAEFCNIVFQDSSPRELSERVIQDSFQEALPRQLPKMIIKTISQERFMKQVFIAFFEEKSMQAVYKAFNSRY